WRLPNISEMASLLDESQTNPALPSGHPFSGVQGGSYWSGSSYAASGSLAWYVDLYGGIVNSSYKSNALSVWPVRGGQ
ncbi:MAG: DUF1566 domain-containing protein, partial [Magnetococcus sp. DMHC-1]